MTRRGIGVDGAPGGWVAATITGAVPHQTTAADINIAFFPTFAEILATAGPTDMIVVDMPIGLADDGQRPADALARERLGPRRSTFFPTPIRAAHDFEHWADANDHSKALTGKGISKQAWNLLPKIAEVDAVWCPDRSDLLLEGHPETSFAEMAGTPVLSKKATPEGRFERITLLQAHLADRIADEIDVADVIDGLPKKWSTDAVDALALTWTAHRVLSGDAVQLGGEPDSLGRPMRVTI